MLYAILSAISYLAICGVLAAGTWIMLEMIYQGWGPKARNERRKDDRLRIVGEHVRSAHPSPTKANHDSHAKCA